MYQRKRTDETAEGVASDYEEGECSDQEFDEEELLHEPLQQSERYDCHDNGQVSQNNTVKYVDSEIQFNFRENPSDEQEQEQRAAKLLADNPGLGNYFQKLFQKGVQQEVNKQWKNKTGNDESMKEKIYTGQSNIANSEETPLKTNQVHLVKSPSDTTIYAPALRKLNSNVDPSITEEVMEKISNFVESVRLETQQRSTPNRVLVQAEDQPSTSRPASISQRIVVNKCTGQPTEQEIDQARKQVIEAEKYSASQDPPPKGLNNLCYDKFLDCDIDLIKRGVDDNIDDDDYFHMICHVDKALKAHIEQGEFVELERLLPKKRNSRGGFTDDGRLEWVTHDGMTYLTPVQDKDNQINGIRRWEQAFRIYASIYCAANPTRTGEIWQYIHTINSIASTYQWDNVQHYDTVFRQMMGDRPERNWSKTYVQLWQLALRDLIQRNGNSTHFSGKLMANQNKDRGQNQSQKKKDWRDNCCWRFNRTGKCDKSNCPFDKRCSYCGMWSSHGSNTCRKRLGIDKQASSSQSSQNNATGKKN